MDGWVDRQMAGGMEKLFFYVEGFRASVCIIRTVPRCRCQLRGVTLEVRYVAHRPFRFDEKSLRYSTVCPGKYALSGVGRLWCAKGWHCGLFAPSLGKWPFVSVCLSACLLPVLRLDAGTRSSI